MLLDYLSLSNRKNIYSFTETIHISKEDMYRQSKEKSQTNKLGQKVLKGIRLIKTSPDQIYSFQRLWSF